MTEVCVRGGWYSWTAEPFVSHTSSLRHKFEKFGRIIPKLSSKESMGAWEKTYCTSGELQAQRCLLTTSPPPADYGGSPGDVTSGQGSLAEDSEEGEGTRLREPDNCPRGGLVTPENDLSHNSVFSPHTHPLAFCPALFEIPDLREFEKTKLPYDVLVK